MRKFIVDRNSVERFRDQIKFEYNLPSEYDQDEEEIMKAYQFGHIDYTEYELRLRKLYEEMEEANEND